MKKEYIYYHEETTTDTRSWNVRSKYKLTDEEVQELCSDHWTDETPTVEGGIRVEYDGTEYGDDAQTETRLDDRSILSRPFNK